MVWQEKNSPFPLDAALIEGRMDLIGDVLAHEYQQVHLKGKKYPAIQFDSGLVREFQDGAGKKGEPMLHVFGGLHLPYNTDRDTALALALKASQDYDGYMAYPMGKVSLVVGNANAQRGYILNYDNSAKRLTEVMLGWNPEEKMDLLPGELRAILPKLYANEKLGMKAIAPMKFFTPDSSWTWYPTEFDGTDIFFGLVSGFDVELGYFRLSELESVQGGFALPIERDLYFEPTTLEKLQAMHNRYG